MLSPSLFDGSAQFFGVGSGRCGSTLLSDLVGLHSDVLSLSEIWTVLGGRGVIELGPLTGRELWDLLSSPSPELAALLGATDIPELVLARSGVPPEVLSKVAPLLLITLPRVHQHPIELLHEIGSQVRAYSRDWPAAHFTRLFAWLCKRLKRRVWLERSGASLEYVDALVAAFPQARFVHIARDGRDCALSMARHPVFRFKLARMLARRPVPVDECLRSEIPLDRFGAYWSALMLRAQALHRLGQDRVLLMRYEELVQNPESQLMRLAGFLGLQAGRARWVESARARIVDPPARRVDLSPAVRARLERACLPGMRVLERLA